MVRYNVSEVLPDGYSRENGTSVFDNQNAIGNSFGHNECTTAQTMNTIKQIKIALISHNV